LVESSLLLFDFRSSNSDDSASSTPLGGPDPVVSSLGELLRYVQKNHFKYSV